jgi:hypothetical protein
MKKLPFIVLGLVLLAAIGLIVLRASMPTAKLTVHAVSPMGTNGTWTNSQGNQETWVLWEFAITNSGRAPADWYIIIVPKGEETNVAYYTVPPAQSEGVPLLPGQSTNVLASVPFITNTTWRATINYDPVPGPLETKLSAWLSPVPSLRKLLPSYGWHSFTGGWLTTTNVTTAH